MTRAEHTAMRRAAAQPRGAIIHQVLANGGTYKEAAKKIGKSITTTVNCYKIYEGYMPPHRHRALRKTVDCIIENALLSAEREATNVGACFWINQHWAEHTYKGTCELTGVKFDAGLFAPALERISRASGYIDGNVRWVLKGIQQLHKIGTTADILKIVKLWIASCSQTKIS